MPTMKDVALLAGVSTATVSHVINGTKHISRATCERVRAAIERIHYEPHEAARSLRSGTSFTVGVLVEDIRPLPVPEIVGGIDQVLEENGYHVLLNDLRLYDRIYNDYSHVFDYKARINRGISLLLQARVDGIIYVGMHDQHIDGLIDSPGKPLVYAYSHGSPADYYVCYENIQGARCAVKCLFAAGCADVAVLAGHPESYVTRRRMEGVRTAFQEAGRPLLRDRVIYGDWEYGSGQRAARALLDAPNPPDAVFAMNDLMAAGFINAAHGMGIRVPEDVSVVGFDDREIAGQMERPLTTVSVPRLKIGSESALMLLSLIRGEKPEKNCKILPCTLIQRASVRETAPRAFDNP